MKRSHPRPTGAPSGATFVCPLPPQGTARLSRPHKPLLGAQGRAESPGPGRSPRSVRRARGAAAAMPEGGALRPRPRAPPGGTAPLPSRRNEARGGVHPAPHGEGRAAHNGAFTFLIRHGEAGGSAAGAGSEAGRGGRAVPALPAPTPPAAAPSIVSCPRCVRLPAPRTPSRANAVQSAPAAGRRRPIGGGQRGGEGSARCRPVGGLTVGAAIFRSALRSALKGAAPRAPR